LLSCDRPAPRDAVFAIPPRSGIFVPGHLVKFSQKVSFTFSPKPAAAAPIVQRPGEARIRLSRLQVQACGNRLGQAHIDHVFGPDRLAFGSPKHGEAQHCSHRFTRTGCSARLARPFACEPRITTSLGRVVVILPGFGSRRSNLRFHLRGSGGIGLKTDPRHGSRTVSGGFPEVEQAPPKGQKSRYF